MKVIEETEKAFIPIKLIIEDRDELIYVICALSCWGGGDDKTMKKMNGIVEELEKIKQKYYK